MIERAYIQERGNGQLEPETESLARELAARGLPVELFTAKRISRRSLPLTRHTLVAGDIPVVYGALKQIGVEPPATNDYPASLEPFLRRRMWRSTVGRARDLLYGCGSQPFFAKPADRMKRFTGRVFESPEDARAIASVSGGTAVVCSEVVEWVSEHRVYVVKGEIVGMRHYSGDPTARLDGDSVRTAVALFTESGDAPAGYGIDFGLLASGETALVEVNDGFSLGSYGLASGLYMDLIVARWEELMSL